MFGINDNTSKFALLEAKRAKRKAIEIENISLAQILFEIENLNSSLFTLALAQEEDEALIKEVNTRVLANTESINTIHQEIENLSLNLNNEISRINLLLTSYDNRIKILENKA
ncbi:hypothetical protein [Aliarcobacter cibarius]|uniref:Uncharacterized protein n=1 Tax=Aliarcobacter cibarius TaxID=255507 RepID=A0ABY2V7K2_9BACT|nr:hypothetical protein [Aliarcobacter cibarius]TLS96184.1 hypothetical protein FE245_10805 [Aliarcobacter cibarius]TLS99956.1 hypothetical protein FE247_05335 [Aliarcobacter cibarius]